jgi:predicted kinase
VASAGCQDARVFVVISGLPGTGKSAVAAAVAERLHGICLSIDPVEDAMLGAGLPGGWTTGVAAYEAVRVVAESNLMLGHSVVVDAVNDSEPARQTWLTASARAGVPLRSVLLTVTDAAEHRRRLEGRVRGFAHLPEPTWEDVQVRAAAFAPWSGDHQAVDADGPLTDVVRVVLERLGA